MTATPSEGGTTLAVLLDARTYETLQQAATERGMAPADLVRHWVRERLAHEAERRLGRARPQRDS